MYALTSEHGLGGMTPTSSKTRWPIRAWRKEDLMTSWANVLVMCVGLLILEQSVDNKKEATYLMMNEIEEGVF